MQPDGYYLGVDLGSVSLDGMVVDGAGRLLWHAYRRVQGRSRDAVAALCRQLLEEWMKPSGVGAFTGALVTGSGKEIVQEMLNIPAVNEIVAHGTAAAGFAGGRASVIEIGGQDSKFILVDEKGPYDYAMNELCAAGTGAFLDVQAERLGLSIEELSAMAAGAETVPSMAGRCSVFAKSDIIHLQQRGVPVDQIVAGLCHALARNYVANLIRGRAVVKPVVFQGGVALNDGVIRAFKDILALDGADIIRPEMPHMAGALGAALLSAGFAAGLDAAMVERAAAEDAAGHGQGEVFSTRGWQMDEAAARMMKGLESFRVVRPPVDGEKVFVGLDIGSISTKAVALTEAGALLAEVYIFTAGRPLEAAKSALGCLAEHISEAAVAAVGVTGSGRKLVGHAVGADLVVDEITAQAKGAWLGLAEADTVIEIGGQDAKFIRLGPGGTVLDFEMNRACSAGTGSFIQEQAVRLGVDLKEEYAELALSSRQPLPFTSRCTVFMESDLVHHIQQGVPLADLLLGVSQAVVENYIDRVAQGRSFGRQVVFQGGVAKNRAVVQAFRNRLAGTEVIVHDHPGVSGAMGMAALTIEMFRGKDSTEPGFATSFRGFRFPTAHRESTFECHGCENRCQVNSFHFEEGRFHFGDLCGRYSETISGLEPGRDLTPDLGDVLSDDMLPGNFTATVGIPRALLFREFYPFWRKYFRQLSIRVKVSAPSSSDCLALALARLPAETCLPVKLLFGHAASLEKDGLDAVFIPSMSRLLDGVSCPYIQHGAAMVQANFDGINVLSLPLVPDLPDRERERLSLKVAELFGVDRAEADLAYAAATRELEAFQRDIAYDLRSSGGPRSRPLAVLLGKPYNIGDRFANMSLAAKLAKAGFDVISYEQLNTSQELPGRYNSITWAASRRMLKIGLWISEIDDVYPVVVGNFGCGPDSFTFPLLEEIFAHRPALFLEFDEHRADAGLATRVEAFAHRVASWRARTRPGRRHDAGEAASAARQKRRRPAEPPDPPGEYILPYTSDHAHAFAGAIRAEGIRARVLPLPDRASYEAAVEFSGGRQCHPFQLIAGDLIRLARSGDLSEGAVYLLPTIESNCLITQYVPTMQLYMDRLGRNDVRVLNTNSQALFDRFGAMFVFKLGKAILGIEYLSRMRFEMRPYETEKGAVDRAYFAALDTILQSQLEGRVNRGIMRAAQLLDAVPTRERGSRPVIAVTGDVYTRVNPVANGGLFDLLEELGCEVWPSPTMVDVIMTGPEVRARQFWEAGKTLNMMSSWGRVLVNSLGAGYVGKSFQGRLANFPEPHAADVLRYTEGILPGEPELLVSLNVAKHVDFANKGVDGILNVYCLNCLVGTTTTSVFRRLTERTAGVPIMPLVFDAMGGTHVRNRVEAFVHRVERNREEKLDRMVAARAGQDGGSHVARLKELLDQKFSDVKMPNRKLSGIKLPDMRLPRVRLPEGLWNWKKK